MRTKETKHHTPTDHQNTELQQHHQIRKSIHILIHIPNTQHPCIQTIQRNSTTSTRTQSTPPESSKLKYRLIIIKTFNVLLFDTLTLLLKI
jgi:hypothetical protein